MKMYALPLAFLLLSYAPLTPEKKVIRYPNGNKHFEYEIKSSVLSGEYTCYYENGKTKLQGQLKNNQKTGIWTAWDENGIKRSQRKFLDDYSFEIINEWDSTGRAIDPEIIRSKNERLIGARSKGLIKKQMRYMHRFWREISPGNANNDFLFNNNSFYRYLITEACNKKLDVYKEDLLINPVEDFEMLKSYRDDTAISYIVKEDLIFTRDHEVMHTVLIGICPVIKVNGETKAVGWFYIPFVRNTWEATDEIENIVTRLEKHLYGGTVNKTTINAGYNKPKIVPPTESDYYLLAPIEFEAQAWIYFGENKWH